MTTLSPAARDDHRRPPCRSVPLSRPARRERQDHRARVPARTRARRRASATDGASANSTAHRRCRTVRRADRRHPHYRLRAQFGDNEVELEDPYRFPPVLSDFDLYLLGEGNHLRLYDKLGAHPMTLDGVDGVAFVSGRRMRSASASSAISISGTAAAMPCACAATAIGKSSCRARAPATNTNTRSSRATARCCRSNPIRSAFAAEMRPVDRLGRRRSSASCRARRRRATTSTRSTRRCRSTRCISARGGARASTASRWLTYRELAEQLPAYAADMGFTHVELLPVIGASVRRLLGLSADRAVCADQPLRLAGGFRRAGRRAATKPGSACCSTGCRAISPTIRTASRISTAPRSTSTPTRARAAISTGAR